MRPQIYSGPDYQMGDVANVSAAETVHAESVLRNMRSSLKGWLKYRRINDEVASGKRKVKVSPAYLARILPPRDYVLEQRLANEIHALLSEVMDAGQLPDPNLNRDPDAAVKLAAIAITGKLPGEAQSPSAQGIIWLWPVVIVVGLVLMTISSKIKADADLAKEKEHYKCIKSGECTDYGFWLKVGGVALAAWIIWDKFNLRGQVKGLLKGKGG